MKAILIFLCLMFFSFSNGQTVYKYYIYLHDSSLAPQFTKNQNNATYSGQNTGLINFFSRYNILKFEKAFPSTNWESFSRVLHLETTSNALADDLLINYPNVYRKYEDRTNVLFELDSYPDDYGTTSPNNNAVALINRDDLDYMNIEKAWNIKTGIGMKIGISDARINPTDLDFSNKLSFINPSPFQSLPYNPGINGLGTRHGTSVAGIAAAQGNNNHGSTGVCYDCEIVATGHGNFDNLLALAQAGVRVINMSWGDSYPSLAAGYFETEQMMIDSLVNHFKVVLVASGGNKNSFQTASTSQTVGNWHCSESNIAQTGPAYVGTRYNFPASYNGVISVSGVGHKYPLILPLSTSSPSYSGLSETLGVENYTNIQGTFANNINGADPYNPVSIIYNGNPAYCNIGLPNQYLASPLGIQPRLTSNPEIDILAPTYNTFSFHIFVEENSIVYGSGASSGAAPRVSGTAALMLNVNTCLIPDEVDDILKRTSKDIESGPLNQVFLGQIGAGALDSGNAVVFVDEMKKNNGNAIIQNHIFKRFDFKLENINNKLSIENVTFSDNCVASFKAKNQIHLLPGTNLKPNTMGSVNLGINPNIIVTCNPVNFRAASKADEEVENVGFNEIVLFPNPNNGSFEVYNIKSKDFNNESIQLSVVDLNGRMLYEKTLVDSEFSNCKIDVRNLSSGMYIVKLSSSNHNHNIKFLKR